MLRKHLIENFLLHLNFLVICLAVAWITGSPEHEYIGMREVFSRRVLLRFRMKYVKCYRMDKHVEGFCLEKHGNQASLSTGLPIAILKIVSGLIQGIEYLFHNIYSTRRPSFFSSCWNLLYWNFEMMLCHKLVCTTNCHTSKLTFDNLFHIFM